LSRPIRTLLMSTLFPSSARPIHGIFVETRLRELLKTGEVETRVVAPVPWFPFRGARFGEYGTFAATPRFEVRNGIEVHHPRYFLPPKIGMNIAPDMIARAALPVIRELRKGGFDFDLIDAHYYYPDGVAAAIIARALGKPFIVTARGTDLNLVPEYPLPRRRILATAAATQASIGVCKALMDRLAELGADPAKLHVLRNGVDLERFVPEPRLAARARLALERDGRWLLSVGHLIERKGHHIAIEALARLPADVRLVIAGAGEERVRLERLAAERGVASRVRFTGAVPQAELKWYYSAADALVLCSSREGWANVLLEAMACGTPVIATDIWGTPEVVATPEAGCLMPQRSPAGLAQAFDALVGRHIDRAATRSYAESFSWHATTAGQLRIMQAIAGAGQRGEVDGMFKSASVANAEGPWNRGC
jgi:teichuronic acid biosynthesis glycosyltransferase TuaC